MNLGKAGLKRMLEYGHKCFHTDIMYLMHSSHLTSKQRKINKQTKKSDCSCSSKSSLVSYVIYILLYRCSQNEKLKDILISEIMFIWFANCQHGTSLYSYNCVKWKVVHVQHNFYLVYCLYSQ